MNQLSTHSIWNPETGITDIEGDPCDLAASEIPGIKAVWADQKERLRGTVQLSDFNEKLSREWAIETGIIENLYEIDRGITQTLIEQGFKTEILSHGSTNKPREYVLQLLLDQKDALDGVFDFVKRERRLSTSYIKELHAALLRSQDTTEGLDTQGHHIEIPLIKGAWKIQANHPMRDDTRYMYCLPEHVAAEMDQLVKIHAEHILKEVTSEVRAAWLHHRFTQIHPFQDGNGRVARALASLVLVQDGLFPLVITRNHKTKYIDVLEKADDGDLKPLIELIVSLQIVQFTKATAISESLFAEEDVQVALDGLAKAADKIAAEKLASFKGVFDLARVIEDDIERRLKEIEKEVSASLQRTDDGGFAYTDRSSEKN